MLVRFFYLCDFRRIALTVLLLIVFGGLAAPGSAATTNGKPLAATPPMGWSNWAHYQCNVTAQTFLANAKALVETGLAARGYNRVQLEGACWWQKDRDVQGNLQIDWQRFPHGVKAVIDAVHAEGLHFGIYQDAGYMTCGYGHTGSGIPNGGGKGYFLRDTRLYAPWGVDYLMLDGCNIYVPNGETKAQAYREAYAAQHKALQTMGRPIIFLESAPAYFLGTPDYYDVLTWSREYGQLWRDGSDIANFDASSPSDSRFLSVLWNYSYNLLVGRFQKPGNWDDADYIIGGDPGMTLAETRSQLALWSMMSSPLILSSDIEKLSPQAISILGNKAVIAIDQDPLGKMATLVRRTPSMDVLLKKLSGGDYAIAVLNHGDSPIRVVEHPTDFGFSANAGCRLDAQNLWNRKRSSASTLEAEVASHDTVVWRVHATSPCHAATRTGAIVMTENKRPQRDQDHHRRWFPSIGEYGLCLVSSGGIERCLGTAAEKWTITHAGGLESAGHCLAIVDGKPTMLACTASNVQHWKYTLVGNLMDAKGQCLTAGNPGSGPGTWSVQACGHNLPNQIWSLPNWWDTSD